jgi:hypothetical protein
MRDAEGNRLHCKRKRNRNRVSASEVAFDELEREKSQASEVAKQRPKVVLPRLWSSEFEALVIRRAELVWTSDAEKRQELRPSVAL